MNSAAGIETAVEEAAGDVAPSTSDAKIFAELTLFCLRWCE